MIYEQHHVLIFANIGVINYCIEGIKFHISFSGLMSRIAVFETL